MALPRDAPCASSRGAAAPSMTALPQPAGESGSSPRAACVVGAAAAGDARGLPKTASQEQSSRSNHLLPAFYKSEAS